MAATSLGMERKETSAKDRLIVALDVPTAADARSIANELRGRVGAFKIGLQLFTSAGPELVREFVESGDRIFLDLKFHDIPNTVAMASVEAARMGVWMFNMHASGGAEMMSAAKQAVDEIVKEQKIPAPLIIAVTLLTSSGLPGKDAQGQVTLLASSAAEAGLNGVVASAHEALAVKETLNDPGFIVVTPGVRPADATNDDQKRVMTPAEAIRSGSDYLVVGRPILNSNDRAAAANMIVDEIASALK